jgi:hypothetical protein
LNIEIKKTGRDRFYVRIPGESVGDSRLQEKIILSVEALLAPGSCIYLNMQEVTDMPGEFFNRLYRLSENAAKKLSIIYYINVRPYFEERIASLTTLS